MELEHLKIETRLTIEKFASAMGEYVTERTSKIVFFLSFGVFFFVGGFGRGQGGGEAMGDPWRRPLVQLMAAAVAASCFAATVLVLSDTSAVVSTCL